jgi:DNA-binding CsgD family transcriptional regulator
VSTPDHSKPKRKRRIAARRARGPQLTERDHEILRWMTRHGVVTTELVGRRFFWRPRVKKYGLWAAYRRLRALQRLGLVLSDKPFAREPAVLRVTKEGARVADVGLRPAPLVLSQLRHSLAVVTLAEFLLAQHSGAELVTERELRAQRYREQRDGDRQTEQGRTPDALLRIPKKGSAKAERIAVELDLSRKDRRALERMIRQYDREDVDRVWWYVTAERVDRTREIVRELHAEDRMEVMAWHG